MQRVLLSDLTTRALRAADQEYGGPVSAAEVKERMLSALRKLYDKLIAARGQEYYRTTVELNTVSGQAVYPLPEDFYKLLSLSANRTAVLATGGSGYQDGVFRVADSGASEGWALLRPYEMLEEHNLLGRPSALPAESCYRLRGTQETSGTAEALTGSDELEIRPCPTSSWTLRLNYIPVAYTTPGTGDLYVNGVNGFEDWAVYKVAIYCAQKEQNDTSELRAEFQEEDRRLDQMAKSRDLGSPERIVDAAGILDGWPGSTLGRNRRRGFWP